MVDKAPEMMGQQEWVNRQLQARYASWSRGAGKTGKAVTSDEKASYMSQLEPRLLREHKTIVERAVAAGRPVLPKNLERYRITTASSPAKGATGAVSTKTSAVLGLLGLGVLVYLFVRSRQA